MYLAALKMTGALVLSVAVLLAIGITVGFIIIKIFETLEKSTLVVKWIVGFVLAFSVLYLVVLFSMLVNTI